MDKLTQDELDVLEYLKLGASNKIIARRMDVSLRTIEKRRRRILLHYGAESAVHLGYIIGLAEGAQRDAGPPAPIDLPLNHTAPLYS